jgi:predicted transcriptional regulator
MASISSHGKRAFNSAQKDERMEFYGGKKHTFLLTLTRKKKCSKIKRHGEF